MKREKLKQISCRVFALFVIYLFVVSPISIGVEAQNGWDEKSAEDKFKEDPKKAIEDVYSGKIKPDEIPDSAWPSIDQGQIPTDKIGEIPPGKVNIEQLKNSPEKLAQISQNQISALSQEQVKTAVIAIGDVTQNKNLFNRFARDQGVSAQLAPRVGNAIVEVGGVIYLENKPHRLELKKIPADVTAVVAIGPEEASDVPGFVFYGVKPGKSVVVAGDKVFEISSDEKGGIIVKSLNAEGRFEQGQYIEKGKTGEITIGDYKISVTYHEKDATISSSEDASGINIQIEKAHESSGNLGKMQYSSRIFTGGSGLINIQEDRVTFDITRGELEVGPDKYSKDFSTTYSLKTGNLEEFSLKSIGSYAVLDGTFIENKEDESKRFVTQYSPLGRTIKQVRHNKVMSSTYGEYLEKISDEKNGEDAVRLLKEGIDKDRERFKQILGSAADEAEKEEIQKRINELDEFEKDITKDGKISIENIKEIIVEKINRLEDYSLEILSKNQNIGYFERADLAQREIKSNMPVNLFILPRGVSAGIVDANGRKTDQIIIETEQGYVVFSPPEYSKKEGKEGELVKYGYVYYGALQKGKANLGSTKVKSEAGIIETRYDVDENGLSNAKISRNSILEGKNIKDAGLIIVGPPSITKDSQGKIIATINMVKLDKDGIHAIAQETASGKTNAYTEPSVIKKITDNYKKVREFAYDVLATAGALTKEAAAKIEETFVEAYEGLESYVREQAKSIPANVLDKIIDINKLKADRNIEGLNLVISDTSLDKQIRDYARQQLLSTYDLKGESNKADDLLEKWTRESPQDEALQKIKEQRKEPKKLAQATAGLTGKESISELEKIIAEKPSVEAYSRLSDLYRQQGDSTKAQEYAELAKNELSLGLERAELDLQKAGFVNAFDFTEKTTEVNKRLAEASYYNKDYSLAEDASRFILAVDKRNTNAQQILSASLVQRRMYDENVKVWETFVVDNPDNIEAKAGLGEAYADNRQYDKAIEQYKKVLEKEPSNLDVVNKIAMVYINKGDYDNAVTELKKITKESGASEKQIIYAQSKIGEIYLAEKKFDEALQYYENALSLDPANKQLQLQLASLYRETKDIEKAKAIYKKLADEGDATSQFMLGKISEEEKDYKQAESYWNQLIENKEAKKEVIDYAKSQIEKNEGLQELEDIREKEEKHKEVFDKFVEELGKEEISDKEYAKRFDDIEAAEKRDREQRKGEYIQILKDYSNSEVRLEALQELSRLYLIDGEYDKAKKALELEINNKQYYLDKLLKEEGAKEELILAKEIYSTLKGLRELNSDVIDKELIDAAGDFGEAESKYGKIHKVFQFMTSRDEKFAETKNELDQIRAEAEKAYSDYLNMLSIDELREEDARLRGEYHAGSIVSTGGRGEGILDNVERSYQIQRRIEKGIRNSKELALSLPEELHDTELFKTLVDARVNLEISQEDSEELENKQKQRHKELLEWKEVNFETPGSGFLDKMEEVPLINSIPSLIKMIGQVAGKRWDFGFDDSLMAAEELAKQQREATIDTLRNSIEGYVEKGEKIKGFREALEEAVKSGEIDTSTEEGKKLMDDLKVELLKLNAQLAEDEAEYKLDKVEDYRNKWKEDPIMAVWNAGFLKEIPNLLIGRTGNHLLLAEAEASRLLTESKQASLVVKKYEEGASLDGIFNENLYLKDAQKLASVDEQYDSQIENDHVIDRAKIDQYFTVGFVADIALLGGIGSRLYSTVGSTVLKGTAKATGETIKVLEKSGYTFWANNLKKVATAADWTLTKASMLYKVSDKVDDVLKKVPVLRAEPIRKVVAEIGVEEAAFGEMFNYIGIGTEDLFKGMQQGAAQDFFDNTNNFLETYYGKTMTNQYIQNQFRQKYSGVKVDVSKYYNPSKGFYDIIQTDNIDIVNKELRLEEGIKIDDSSFLYEIKGREPIIVTTNPNFAMSNDMFKVASAESMVDNKGAISTVYNIEVDDAAKLVKAQNSDQFYNTHFDSGNNIVTAEQEIAGKSQKVVIKPSSVDIEGKTITIKIADKLEQKEAGKRIDEAKIENNVNDISSHNNLKIVIADDKVDVKRGKVLVAQNEKTKDVEIVQEVNLEGISAEEFINRVREDKQNRFQIEEEGSGKVLLRDRINGNKIIINTGKEIIKDDAVEIGSFKADVLGTRKVTIVDEKIITTEDAVPIRQVEIRTSIVELQENIKIEQESEKKVKIIKEAKSENDNLIFEREGEKFLVVPEGKKIEKIENKKVITPAEAISQSIKANLESEYPHPVISRNIKKIDEISAEISSYIETKSPKEAVIKLYSLGIIDENLKLNIDNRFLENYLSKVRALVEKPRLTPEQITQLDKLVEEGEITEDDKKMFIEEGVMPSGGGGIVAEEAVEITPPETPEEQVKEEPAAEVPVAEIEEIPTETTEFAAEVNEFIDINPSVEDVIRLKDIDMYLVQYKDGSVKRATPLQLTQMIREFKRAREKPTIEETISLLTEEYKKKGEFTPGKTVSRDGVEYIIVRHYFDPAYGVPKTPGLSPRNVLKQILSFKFNLKAEKINGVEVLRAAPAAGRKAFYFTDQAYSDPNDLGKIITGLETEDYGYMDIMLPVDKLKVVKTNKLHQWLYKSPEYYYVAEGPEFIVGEYGYMDLNKFGYRIVMSMKEEIAKENRKLVEEEPDLVKRIMNENSFLARSFIDKNDYEMALNGKNPQGESAPQLKTSPWEAYNYKADPQAWQNWKRAKTSLNEKVKEKDKTLDLETILGLFDILNDETGEFWYVRGEDAFREPREEYFASQPGKPVWQTIPKSTLEKIKKLQHLEIRELDKTSIINEELEKEGKDPNDFVIVAIKYPDGSKVKGELSELLEWYNQEIQKPDVDPVELAARFQQEFITIHPFKDFNGRISRLLMDNILASYGLPPAFLEDTSKDQWLAPEEWIGEVKKGVEASKEIIDEDVIKRAIEVIPIPALQKSEMYEEAGVKFFEQNNIVYGAELAGQLYYDFSAIGKAFPGVTRQQAVDYLYLHEVFHGLITKSKLKIEKEEMAVDLLAKEKTGMGLTAMEKLLLQQFKDSLQNIDSSLQELFNINPFDYSKDIVSVTDEQGVTRQKSEYAEAQLVAFINKLSQNENKEIADLAMINIQGAEFTDEFVAELKEKGAKFTEVGAAEVEEKPITGIEVKAPLKKFLFLRPSLFMLYNLVKGEYNTKNYQKADKQLKELLKIELSPEEKELAITYRLKANIGLLKDTDPYTRTSAIWAIRYEIQDARALPYLFEALKNDPEPSVKIESIKAIKAIKETEGLRVPYLIKASKEDSNGLVRKEAISAIVEIGGIKALPYLFEALNSQDSSAREAAISGIGYIEGIKALPYLFEALKDSSLDVRGRALWEIGRIEGIKALPYLFEALKNQGIKNVAIKAIEEIKEQSMPYIIEKLDPAKEPSPDIRREIATQFVKIKNKEYLIEGRTLNELRDLIFNAVGIPEIDKAILMRDFIEPLALIKPELFDEETLLELTSYYSDEELRYTTFYSTKRIGKDIKEKKLEDIISREVSFEEGKERLHERTREIIGEGPKKALIIHNIKDGMGDELTRLSTLTQAFLDSNPELQVVIYTNRPYLYDNERVTVKNIKGIFEKDKNFDMVIDYYDTNQRYSDNLEKKVKPWIEDEIKPRIYIRANKATDSFVYEKIEVDGKAISIPKGIDLNVYDPIYRLSAELGLPFKVGEEAPRTLILGIEDPKSSEWWKKNIADKNIENRPVAVLNGFGGESSDKGFFALGDYTDAVIELINKGYFVVITPNDKRWGNEKNAKKVVDAVPSDINGFVAITPEPQKNPKLLKHVAAKSDIIITVEGGLMHLSYNLAKPFFALQMEDSGDFSKWLSYALSSRQKIVRTLRQDSAEMVKEIVKKLAYTEDLTTFEVSEGFQAAADASLKLSGDLASDKSFNSQSAESLVALAPGMTVAGIRVRDATGKIEDVAIASKTDGQWVIEIDKKRLEKKLEGLSTAEKDSAVRIILAHEIAEVKAHQTGLPDADSHVAAMMVEADIMAKESEKLTAEQLDNIRKRLWKTRQDFSEAQHDIASLTKMMASYLGLEIKPEDIPKVVPSPAYLETSAYDPENNIIYIHQNHIGDGSTYGEEINHRLRELVIKGKEEKISLEDKSAVDEFFGRIGEDLLRNLAQNTEYAKLFEGYERRDWSSPEELKKRVSRIGKLVNGLYLLNKKFEEIKDPSLFILKHMDEISTDLSNANKQRHAGEITNEEFFNSVAISYDRFREGLSKLIEEKRGVIEVKLVISFGKGLGYIYEQKDTFEKAEEWKKSDDPERRPLAPKLERVADEAIDMFVEDLPKSTKLYSGQIDFYSLITPLERVLEMSNYLSHLGGYVAAELFMEKNPDWQQKLPELIKMPSNDILKNYVDTKEVGSWIKEHGLDDLVKEMEEKAEEKITLTEEQKSKLDSILAMSNPETANIIKDAINNKILTEEEVLRIIDRSSALDNILTEFSDLTDLMKKSEINAVLIGSKPATWVEVPFESGFEDSLNILNAKTGSKLKVIEVEQRYVLYDEDSVTKVLNKNKNYFEEQETRDIQTLINKLFAEEMDPRAGFVLGYPKEDVVDWIEGKTSPVKEVERRLLTSADELKEGIEKGEYYKGQYGVINSIRSDLDKGVDSSVVIKKHEEKLIENGMKTERISRAEAKQEIKDMKEAVVRGEVDFNEIVKSLEKEIMTDEEIDIILAAKLGINIRFAQDPSDPEIRGITWDSIRYGPETEAAINRYEKAFQIERAVFENKVISEEKPATEKTKVEEAAKIELEWWEGRKEYIQDEKDIQKMAESSEVVELKDGAYYKISPAMRFKLATPEVNSFIEQIADEWVKELESQGIKIRNKLMITSAARTTEYQKELISEGYHAAERSSHTLGVAFDVADKYFPAKWFNPLGWLKRNDKSYADALNKVFNNHKENGDINLIAEESMGVWHAALHPDYYRGIGNKEIEGPTLETQLQSFALRSSLVPNLNSLTARNEYLTHYVKEEDKVSILHTNIQAFKELINDKFGHLVGDKYINAVGSELEELVEEEIGTGKYETESRNGISIIKINGDGEILISHEGGKSYSIIGKNVDEDLMRRIGEATISNSFSEKVMQKIEQEYKTKLYMYSGLATGNDADEVNQKSLKAAKTAQLDDIGSLSNLADATQQKLDEAKAKEGSAFREFSDEVYNYYSGLEKGHLVYNEYDFFGQEIKNKGIVEALEKLETETSEEGKNSLIKTIIKSSIIENGFFSSSSIANVWVQQKLIEGNKIKQIDIDLNFFGETNTQLGVKRADELKYGLLSIMEEVVGSKGVVFITGGDEIKIIADEDADAKKISLEIMNEYNELAKEDIITIDNIKTHPSLTMHTTKKTDELAEKAKSGKLATYHLNKQGYEGRTKTKADGKEDMRLNNGKINFEKFYSEAEFVMPEEQFADYTQPDLGEWIVEVIKDKKTPTPAEQAAALTEKSALAKEINEKLLVGALEG